MNNNDAISANAENQSVVKTNDSILELKATQVTQGSTGFDYEGGSGTGFTVIRPIGGGGAGDSGK